jgi:hypothetical protein
MMFLEIHRRSPTIKKALGAMTIIVQGTKPWGATRYPNKDPNPKSSRKNAMAIRTHIYPMPDVSPSQKEAKGGLLWA